MEIEREGNVMVTDNKIKHNGSIWDVTDSISELFFITNVCVI